VSTNLLTDLYQIKMMYAHWVSGTHRTPATFDMYFRTAPHGASGAVVAGVYEALQWIAALGFTEADIAYLREADAELSACDPAFWEQVIRPFRFSGDIDAMPDGTRVFPGEPIVRVTAPVAEAQYIESHLLEKINSMTLISSKADRIVHAAGGDPVIEMGLRRGQGDDAAIDGAKAAYQAGVASTSNLEAGRRYGIPVAGTNAHAWLQFFPTELEAMRAWARAYDSLVLLIDTYDTLNEGLPCAMQVARESGKPLRAIRIDSGDLAYISKQVRARLDAGGFSETRIIASSDLDEQIIQNLKLQGAPIDIWGVGTQLITGGRQAALGGVYKLSAVGRAPAGAGDPAPPETIRWEPRIKLSENPAKVTLPGRKQVVRFYQDGLMAGDALLLADEPLPGGDQPFILADPVHRWKQQTLQRYEAFPVLEPMLRAGRAIHPELLEGPRAAMLKARSRCEEQNRALRDEYRRLLNPEYYPVGTSDALYDLQQRMIAEHHRHT
jgi:nicotinate phosphoribosyltransferase